MELAGLRHDLQFGADAEYRLIYRSDLLRQAASSTFSYLNPIYGLEQPSATVSASDSDQRDQLHNQSLFLQDAIHLSDRWVLTTGLRYQTWRQTAGRGRPFKANTQADGTAWLPRAGLVYRLDNGLSLYGNYSQSLRPTSTIAPLASGTIIDSGVAPEEARSWEVGAKLDLPGQLTGTLALFDILAHAHAQHVAAVQLHGGRSREVDDHQAREAAVHQNEAADVGLEAGLGDALHHARVLDGALRGHLEHARYRVAEAD
jgi:iron complex outermembrane receptor protein